MNWLLIVQFVVLLVAIRYTFVSIANIFFVAASWLEGPCPPMKGVKPVTEIVASLAWALLFFVSNL